MRRQSDLARSRPATKANKSEARRAKDNGLFGLARCTNGATWGPMRHIGVRRYRGGAGVLNLKAVCSALFPSCSLPELRKLIAWRTLEPACLALIAAAVNARVSIALNQMNHM